MQLEVGVNSCRCWLSQKLWPRSRSCQETVAPALRAVIETEDGLGGRGESEVGRRGCVRRWRPSISPDSGAAPGESPVNVQCKLDGNNLGGKDTSAPYSLTMSLVGARFTNRSNLHQARGTGPVGSEKPRKNRSAGFQPAEGALKCKDLYAGETPALQFFNTLGVMRLAHYSELAVSESNQRAPARARRICSAWPWAWPA